MLFRFKSALFVMLEYVWFFLLKKKQQNQFRSSKCLYLYWCSIVINTSVILFQPKLPCESYMSILTFGNLKNTKALKKRFPKISNLNDFSALIQIIWTRHFPQHLKAAAFKNTTHRMISFLLLKRLFNIFDKKLMSSN